MHGQPELIMRSPSSTEGTSKLNFAVLKVPLRLTVEDVQSQSTPSNQEGPLFGGKKVYTKGVFSSENPSVSTVKKEFWCIPKSLFSREKRRKIHIRQRAFKVFVGTPRAILVCRFWPPTFGFHKVQGTSSIRKTPHGVDQTSRKRQG